MTLTLRDIYEICEEKRRNGASDEECAKLMRSLITHVGDRSELERLGSLHAANVEAFNPSINEMRRLETAIRNEIEKERKENKTRRRAFKK